MKTPSDENGAAAILSALRRISHATDSHSKALSRFTGLSLPQRIVLDAVATLGETTTGKLSKAVSLSQATVTVVLDKLEDKGLVERYRSRTDRRIVHARLCAKGRRVLMSLPPTPYDNFLDRLYSLEPTAQKRLRRVVEDIAVLLEDALRKPGASAPPPPRQPTPAL